MILTHNHKIYKYSITYKWKNENTYQKFQPAFNKKLKCFMQVLEILFPISLYLFKRI